MRVVPFLEIDPRPPAAEGGGGDLLKTSLQALGKRLRLLSSADQGAERADHGENAGHVALVEGVHGNAGADQLRDDVGLQVGEGEHQVRLERQDLGNVGRGEGGDARLLAAHARGPHAIARDAGDAMLLAEEVERLDRLFGEADDPRWRELAQENRLGRAAQRSGRSGEI